MRRNNKKKGFTIVELVIVIAVIGILAAVMIPTFASVISDANEKAALQAANNAYKEAYTKALADGKIATLDKDGNVEKGKENEETQTAGGFTFKFTEGEDGKISCEVTAVPEKSEYKCVSVKDGVVSVAKNHTDEQASETDGHGTCDVCGRPA